MTGFESKRRAAQAKLDDDDDTQVYSETLLIVYHRGFSDGKAAAQRQWVGLTPEEILDLFDRNNVYGSKWIEFARTVEAKLKEKNGH
jgi:hypothetical protein